MTWRQRLADLGHRLRALWSRRRLDRELDEELRFHLEMATERNLRRGLEPEEARRAALREFGGLEQHRERARDERGVRLLETLAFDLRLGARSLRRTPAVTGAALLTVALAVGATTLIWAVVDAVLLRPLPYPEPERLVQVWESHPEKGPRNVVSRGNYLDWVERADAFAALGAYMPGFGRGLTGDGRPVQVTTALVTPGLLRLLGVEAAVGRTFTEAEGEPGRDDAALLSEGFWRRRFGADPGAVGRTLTLDGSSYRVVGVMPRGVDVPSREVDVWLPMAFPPGYHEQREAHVLHVLGRLAPGTSPEAADAAMDRLARSLGEEHPEVAGWEVDVVPLHEERVGEVRPALLVLLAAVAMLLAAACFNVANLLLARGTARTGEVAVRAALGASRRRLVRQLLTESLLLAVTGGALGAALAAGGLEVLRSSQAAQLPRLADAVLDLRVLAVTAGLSLLTGAAVGILPAIRDSRADLRRGLGDGSPGAASGQGRDRLRHALVAAQVALAVVLLAGSGLLLRSFLELRSVEPGFEPEGLLAVSLNLPSRSYPETPDHARFYEDLIERLDRLPRVASVAATSEPPIVGYDMRWTPIVEGETEEWQGEGPALRVVTEGYFETLGIPRVAGRTFTRFDRGDAPRVLVANETMALRLGGDPLGRRLAFDPEGPWYEVVGVVGDTRHRGLEAPVDPALYGPLAQKGWHWLTWMTVVLRAGGDPLTLVDEVRDEVWALNPDLPVLDTRTVEAIYADSRARRRFHTLLLSLFAGFALILGTVGLYGVTAFSVARRTREIGIRMALGARRRSVAGLVLRQAAAITALGLATGTAAALAASRWMASLLFGVGPHDPATFAATAALLAAVSLAACYLPARRAARLDPTRALK